jgi:hypothetical protein
MVGAPTIAVKAMYGLDDAARATAKRKTPPHRVPYDHAAASKWKRAQADADGNLIDALDGTVIRAKEATVDHVIPLACASRELGPESDAFRAFANDPDNWILTSLANNSRKGDKDLMSTTAMFPALQVGLTSIGRTVAERYGLKSCK